MKKLAKGTALILGFALLVWMHNQKRKEQQAGWKEYGRQILGLGCSLTERNRDLDKLRFLAAVLVIAVHSMQSAAEKIVPMLTEEGLAQEKAWLWGVWYGLTGAAGLGLCCNLLFILISGVLLLPYRRESAAVFYCKRISKVLIPLAAYYLFYLRRSGLLFLSFSSILSCFKMVISGSMELVPHFWLVYVLIGLYLGVPFFRWMLKAIPETLLKGMALMIILGAAGKTVFYFLGLGLSFQFFLFSWEGIFLLGYFFVQPCSRDYRKMTIIAGGISGAVIVFLSCFRKDASVIAANDSLLMILFSLAVFLLAADEDRGKGKKAKKKENFAVQMAIQVGSRYSYSILLIHWFMLFVVVEKHLHIEPFIFGTAWIWLGLIIQSALTFLFSLIFALVYDQTVVFFVEWGWEKLFNHWHFLQKSRKIRF